MMRAGTLKQFLPGDWQVCLTKLREEREGGEQERGKRREERGERLRVGREERGEREKERKA